MCIVCLLSWTSQLCIFVDQLLRDPNTDPNVPLLAVFNEFRERIATDELNEQFSCIHEARRVPRRVSVAFLSWPCVTACLPTVWHRMACR